jgi:hypothetical protein
VSKIVLFQYCKKAKITYQLQHVAGGYSITRGDIHTSRKVPKKIPDRALYSKCSPRDSLLLLVRIDKKIIKKNECKSNSKVKSKSGSKSKSKKIQKFCKQSHYRLKTN